MQKDNHKSALRGHGFRAPLLGVVCGLAIGALPLTGYAHQSDGDKHGTAKQDSYSELQADGLALKRSSNTGKGMPSVRGPFPDTFNMEFLGQLTNAELGATRLVFTGASFMSDIWGWTSPSAPHHEYAIVGTTSGVAFARITDPANPEFLGRVPTTDTGTLRNFWWDIKTYNNHAYWTTEVNDAGVGIFDLTRLDGLSAVPPDATLDADAYYDGAGYRRAHNISINEDTGFAYLTGASKDPAADPGFVDDGIIILDLKVDPLAPVEVGQIVGNDTHDAQIVSYAGPDPDYQNKEIAVVFNGIDLTVGFYDVTDKNNITTISETTYAGASFTHQGWLTEDHTYLLAGDEEDELFGISDPRNPDLPDTARTYIWDVSDLDNPGVIGSFDSPAASIDHNLFVKGDKVYQAHYTAGIRVLDASDVANGNLSELGHMDTEPRLPNNHMNHNVNIWVGPWGVFPYFDSGTIIASDGLNGLIMMRLDNP